MFTYSICLYVSTVYIQFFDLHGNPREPTGNPKTAGENYVYCMGDRFRKQFIQNESLSVICMRMAAARRSTHRHVMDIFIKMRSVGGFREYFTEGDCRMNIIDFFLTLLGLMAITLWDTPWVFGARHRNRLDHSSSL